MLLLFAAVASAQAVSTAQINGTVRDASGGALPGVTVTATQTATGLKRETTTSENGSYVLTNLPVGPYMIDVVAAGIPLVSADRPRPRSQREPDPQRHARTRPARGNSLGRGQRVDGGDTQPWHRAGDHQPAGARVAAQRAAVDAADLSGRPGHRRTRLQRGPGRQRAQQRAQLSNRDDYRGRRHGERHHLPAGRWHAQRPLQSPEPAAAVPRCAAGVQGRNQRAARAVRPSLGGRRQRRDEVGDQPVARQRVRVLPRQIDERARIHFRPWGPTASGATMACGGISSAGRWAARSCATSCSTSSATRGRRCTSRRRRRSPTCRRRGCSRAISR